MAQAGMVSQPLAEVPKDSTPPPGKLPQTTGNQTNAPPGHAPIGTTKPAAGPQQPSSNSAKRRPSGQLVPWHEASSDEESEYESDGEFEDDSDQDDGDGEGEGEGEEQGMDGEEDGEGTQEGSEEEVGKGALALANPHEGAEQITIKVTVHKKDAPDSKRVYALWDNVRAMQQVAPGSRRTVPGVFRLCDSNFVPVAEGGKPKFVTGQWLELEGGYSERAKKYRSSIKLAEDTVLDGKTYKAGREMGKLLPDAPGIPIKPREPGQLSGPGKVARPGGSTHRRKASPRTLVGLAGMDEVERLRFRLAAVQPPLDKYTEEVSIEYHKYACRGDNGRADKMYCFRGKLHRSVVELIDTLQDLEKDQAPDGISASMEWMMEGMGLQHQGFQCCPARFYECLVKDPRRSRTASMAHVFQDLFSMNYVFVPVVVKGRGALAVICNPGDPHKRGIVYIQDGVEGFVVGQRLRVFWSGEQAWFKGTIGAINKDNGKYQVLYDDGDVQWEDLGSEKVELLPADSAPKPAKPGKTRASKTRAGEAATGKESKGSGVTGMEEEEADGREASKPESQAGPDPNQVAVMLLKCLKREWNWSTAKAGSVAAAAMRQRQQPGEAQQEQQAPKPEAEGDQEQRQKQQQQQGKEQQEQQQQPQQQQEQLQLALAPLAPPLDDFSHTPLLIITLANATKHHQTRGFVLACFHYMCKLASDKHGPDAGDAASDQAQPQAQQPDVIVVGGEQIVLGMDGKPEPMQGGARAMDSLFDRLSWLKADGLVPSGDELINQLKASFPTLQEFMDDWDAKHAEQQQQPQELLLLEAPPPADQQLVLSPPQQPQQDHDQTNKSSQKKKGKKAKRQESAAANDDPAAQQDQQQQPALDQPSLGSLGPHQTGETMEQMDTDMQPYVDYIPASHETNVLTDSGTQECGRHDGNGRQVTLMNKKSVSSGFFITEPRGKKRPNTEELMKPPRPRR